MNSHKEVMSIALSVQDLDIRRHLERIIDGVQSAGIKRANGEQPTAYFLDMGDTPDYALEKAASLKKSGKARLVLMTGARAGTDFLIRCMQAGVDEFLPYPVSEKDLLSALERYSGKWEVSVSTPEPPRGKIYGVLGARNGVGTTTVAVNLALELQKKGLATALFDFARPCGDAALFLDAQTEYSWLNALQNLERLDATFIESIMCPHASGLKLLAAPGYPESLAPIQTSAMEMMLEAAAQNFDAIVIDLGGGMSKRLSKLIEIADRVFLVTLQSLPSLANAKSVISLCNSIDPDMEKKIDLVVNRPSRKVMISMDEAEKITGKSVAYTIPDDGDVVLAAINQGIPLAVGNTRSNAAKAVRKMAGGVNSPTGKGQAARHFWFF